MIHLTLRLKKKREARVVTGHPWVYASDLEENSALVTAEMGELARIETAEGRYIATGFYNAKSVIAARILTRRQNESIDAAFIGQKLQQALSLRERLFKNPYYRLVHSEGDGLPGLVIDRFDQALVVQVTTAGMERLMPLILESLDTLLSPETIILRNDTPARSLEGLKSYVQIAKGEYSGPSQIIENDTIYLADLVKGQKTGWFYDHRANRARIAALAKGKTVLDVYSHSGGFGLVAAKAGADVTLVDSSALALDLAKEAAKLNGVSCEAIEGKAYDVLEQLNSEKRKFDFVLTDPPAFVKHRKDMGAGLKGYEKLAKLCAFLVNPGGIFFLASCSHHAPREQLIEAVASGLFKAGREGKIIQISGADRDHPQHPFLPENDYLKAIMVSIA